MIPKHCIISQTSSLKDTDTIITFRPHDMFENIIQLIPKLWTYRKFIVMSEIWNLELMFPQKQCYKQYSLYQDSSYMKYKLI